METSDALRELEVVTAKLTSIESRLDSGTFDELELRYELEWCREKVQKHMAWLVGKEMDDNPF